MTQENKKEGFWKKHSHKKGFSILALIVFAPIGIWLIFKHKHFQPKTRYIISAIAAVWFAYIIIDAQPTEEEIQAEEAAKVEREAEQEAKKVAKEEEKADKDAAKKEKKEAEEKEKAEEKKEKEEAIEYGIELWEAEEDGTKDFLMEEHRDNGLIDVGPNNDDYSVMNAIVAEEFRLLTDEEKEYLINQMGNSIRNLVGSHFGHLDANHKSQVHVNFMYHNGESVASQKMSGGWKIK